MRDAEIDTAVKTVEAGEARLVVAAATDGELRAVVRRLVRRYAPPPSKRPAELPADRTVFDLPPLAVLPLAPAVPDLVGGWVCRQQPADVAAATLGGRERRLDLLRNDAGSVTLHGCMLGGCRCGRAARAVAGPGGGRRRRPHRRRGARDRRAPSATRVRPMWTVCRWSSTPGRMTASLDVAVARARCAARDCSAKPRCVLRCAGPGAGRSA